MMRDNFLIFMSRKSYIKLHIGIHGNTKTDFLAKQSGSEDAK